MPHLDIKKILQEQKQFGTFKYIQNLKFGVEIEEDEVAVYQIGDLDGSFAREILADFINITEEGFYSLLTLLKKECFPKPYSKWQASDEIFLIFIYHNIMCFFFVQKKKMVVFG